VAIAAISGFTPIQTMGHMASLGTLFAFAVVAIGVMILRIKKPELERPFKCPAVFIVAPLAIAGCAYLIYSLLGFTGRPFAIWGILGLMVYFLYSYKKSPLKGHAHSNE
jgi:APA family basic amino acid/polyamine antiporter